MSRFALALAAALSLVPAAAAGCRRAPTTTEDAPLAALDARHEPLRDRFDAAAGSPRIVMLASPT